LSYLNPPHAGLSFDGLVYGQLHKLLCLYAREGRRKGPHVCGRQRRDLRVSVKVMRHVRCHIRRYGSANQVRRLLD
jgi:hypothetical protein